LGAAAAQTVAHESRTKAIFHRMKATPDEVRDVGRAAEKRGRTREALILVTRRGG
jgi:hypothetical protein